MIIWHGDKNAMLFGWQALLAYLLAVAPRKERRDQKQEEQLPNNPLLADSAYSKPEEQKRKERAREVGESQSVRSMQPGSSYL